MKKENQILEYIRNRAIELTTAFKKERKLMNQWEPSNSFYEDHRYFMLQHSEKLEEIKKTLDFITGSDKAFYDIYNSINI